MTHRTRKPRSGQDTTPRPSESAEIQRAHLRREIKRLPFQARVLLTRSHVASAALAAVAIALSLDPGSQAWIAARLVAAYPFAVGYLMRLGASLDDAQEITQASILAALSKASTFDPSRIAVGDPLRGWFKGFLLNTWRDRRRWARERFEVPLDLTLPRGLSMRDHAARVEARDLLFALHAATTPERWRAWWAYEIDREFAADIAEREQVPRSAIEWRIRCARKDFDSVLRTVGRTRRTRRSKGGA